MRLVIGLLIASLLLFGCNEKPETYMPTFAPMYMNEGYAPAYANFLCPLIGTNETINYSKIIPLNQVRLFHTTQYFKNVEKTSTGVYTKVGDCWMISAFDSDKNILFMGG